MAKLIFKLRNVPEDEAQDIRQLLFDNEIKFYETHAGNWGIGMAGIWVSDNEQYIQAMVLIEEYQKQRSDKFHKEYADLKDSGLAPTLLSNIFISPFRFLVYIFSIVVILYISIIPFAGI